MSDLIISIRVRQRSMVQHYSVSEQCLVIGLSHEAGHNAFLAIIILLVRG